MTASRPEAGEPAGPETGQRPGTGQPQADERQVLANKTRDGRDLAVSAGAPIAGPWAPILDAMPDAVAILDNRHRIVFANKAMAQRLRVTQDECVGQACHACVHGSSQPLASCPHSKLIEDGLEHTAQIHEKMMGGDFLVSVSPLFDDDGHLVGAVHVAHDITSRIRAEEAVRESEQRFRDLAELLPQVIYEMDLDGRITFANRNAYEVFGYTPEALQAGVNNLEMVVPAERDRARRNMERIASGEESGCNEYTAQRQDGHRFPIAIYSSVIVRDGRPVGFRGIVVDITQRKETERALAAAKEAAEAADRAKSEFLANISHEIRTPLTSILSLSEMLMVHEMSAPARGEHLRTIGRSADNLLTLVNDILDLSRIDSGKTELESIDCSLPQIVEEIGNLMQFRAKEKQLRFDIHYEFPLPGSIRTDPVRLRQILVNLVGNAIKFTENGGVRITVRSSRTDELKTQVRFEVADTGIGMARDDLSRIFEPFTQADASHTRRFGGTGLGLSISQKLAKMLGGKIEVQSEVGTGSTFVLSLELGELDNVPMLQVPDAEVSADEPSARPKQGPQVSGHILLAEDDADVRGAIRLALEVLGVRVDTAENGRTAIEKALRAKVDGKPHDLILMDIRMPEIDGYEVTRQLRREGWNGPIVALTAHVMTGDREKCLDAGCDDYVSKPVSRVDLIDVVARHLQAAGATPLFPSVSPEPSAAPAPVPNDGRTSGP